MALSYFTDALVLAAVLALTYIVKRSRATNKRYYPGPPGRLFFGNFFDFPTHEPYKKYAEWSKSYLSGGVVHLEAFGQHVLVLNTQEACSDLLDKRSLNYSDRALTPVMTSTHWPTWSMGFSGYNPHWKDIRRLGTQYMKDENVGQYRDTQANKAAQLITNLVATPADLEDHLRTESAGTIMSIIYGYDVSPRDDPFVALARDAMRAVSDATFYRASDVINEHSTPLLYLPSWMPFKKHMARTQRLAQDMRDVPFNGVKKGMLEGTSRDSIVSALLTKLDGGSEEQQKTIKDLAASLYVGGADSTPAILCSFIFFMVLHPDIQRKAQDELDRVVGRHRLPTYSDRAGLPYLEAVVRETFRCALVTPLGISHYSMEDDEYNGYFIPKGTVVISNIWAISNDETLYPNPTKFDPTRFLSADGEYIEAGKLGDTYLFGYGRRKCPGRYLADNTAWITLAYLLSTLDMMPSAAAKGSKVKTSADVEYVEGLIYQVNPPFECVFIPRSDEAMSLIQEAVTV